jgi:hypothetical protein
MRLCIDNARIIFHAMLSMRDFDRLISKEMARMTPFAVTCHQ